MFGPSEPDPHLLRRLRSLNSSQALEGDMRYERVRIKRSRRSNMNHSGARDMTQATSQTIAVEHIKISSERSFDEVRRRLEATLPRLDASIAEALGLR